MIFATKDGKVDIDAFTQQQIIDNVQTGQGGNYKGNGKILQIKTLFGGPTPADVKQDMVTGKNIMTSAKVASFGSIYIFGDIARKERRVFELSL